MREGIGRRHTMVRWYHAAGRAYSAVPYYCFPNGLALPAWHYFFEVTRRCNLRCAMCQYRNRQETAPASSAPGTNELGTDEWRNVISQTGRLSLLTFTGGEPFVRGDIMELLEYASGERRIHLITNGLGLTESCAARLVELAPGNPWGKGFQCAGVSIEGPREVHDRITGLDGAFEKAAKGLATLAERRRTAGKGRPLLYVSTVIQQANVHVLPEMVKVVAECGADILNLVAEIRMFDVERVGTVDPYVIHPEAVSPPRIDPMELREALEAAKTAADEAGVALRVPRMSQAELVRYYSGGLDLRAFECRAAWTSLYVNAEGNVSSCLIHHAGNVREQPLRAIWNGTAMRDWRKRHRRRLPALCQGCCELEHRGSGGETR